MSIIMDKKYFLIGLLFFFQSVSSEKKLIFKPNMVVLPSLNLNTTDTANDIAVRNVLIDLATGNLPGGTTILEDLIKNGISESAIKYPENSRSYLRAGAKKAQILVSDVTAAYTQAIFRAKSTKEARELLGKFQNTIQMIVDFTKSGKYTSY